MPQTATENLLSTVLNLETESDEINASVQAFFDAADALSADEATRTVQRLSSGFSCPDKLRGGLLTMVCGVLLERGATPGVAGTAYLSWLEGTLAEQAAGDERAEAAFEQFWPAAIAFLSANPKLRAAAQHLQPLLEPTLETQNGAHWISRLLPVMNEEPILVLEPETGLGFVGSMSGVADNFQLHTLLMGAFPKSDPLAPPRGSTETLEVARGVGPQESRQSVRGVWNLYSWRAILPDGTLKGDQGDTQHWIWGETPTDIPVFDDHRVVLLGKASYERGWGSSRQFKSLRADIRVEKILSADEVSMWLRRMATNAG